MFFVPYKYMYTTGVAYCIWPVTSEGLNVPSLTVNLVPSMTADLCVSSGRHPTMLLARPSATCFVLLAIA